MQIVVFFFNIFPYWTEGWSCVTEPRSYCSLPTGNCWGRCREREVCFSTKQAQAVQVISHLHCIDPSCSSRWNNQTGHCETAKFTMSWGKLCFVVLPISVTLFFPRLPCLRVFWLPCVSNLGLAPVIVLLSPVLQKSSCAEGGWFVRDDFKLSNVVICCCSCYRAIIASWNLFGCACLYREHNLFWVIEDTLLTAVYGASSSAWIETDCFAFDADILTLSFHRCNCICIFSWVEFNTQTANVLRLLRVVVKFRKLVVVSSQRKGCPKSVSLLCLSEITPFMPYLLLINLFSFSKSSLCLSFLH